MLLSLGLVFNIWAWWPEPEQPPQPVQTQLPDGTPTVDTAETKAKKKKKASGFGLWKTTTSISPDTQSKSPTQNG
ncbi:hypothetical protein [Vibrio diabolicus]|uniref:hypothetical protein n=1 Tax=Vibrio diabolicus TaxID=50719 RepID=UPI0021751375|nr:hypothetical protein [Vibrio diabolicus]